MCGHSDSADKITQKIEQELYPAIKEQFCLAETDIDDVHFYVALTALKTEFLLLSTYETRLVFPSILKVFNTKHLTKLPELPNIAELQQLTRHKEQRLLQLVQAFAKEYEKAEVPNPAADKLIRLFFEDFILIKNEWNNMISIWSKGCACFQRANLLTLNKKEYAKD